jgi:cob(I)alamin adenosyltransferase
VKKSSVYTKGGDKGQTSLVSGARLEKSNPRIDLYGEVDELNSHIGYLLSLDGAKYLDSALNQKIQSALFDLGSRLACESENWTKFKLPELTEKLLSQIEKEIDSLDSNLTKMKFFVLPAGNAAAAYGHVVRTVTRRVERRLVDFSLGNEIPHLSLELLNRLSDYFFVVSRYINYKEKISETSWIPNE